MATQWYYQDGGEERGPVVFRELVDLVRSGSLTENDLVRSSWKPDWQRADSVVGLFHMAGCSAEDLARLDAAATPLPAAETLVAETVAEIARSDSEELTERPGWMTRLFTLTGFRKQPPAEIPILGPALADDSAATDAPEASQPQIAATEQLRHEQSGYAGPVSSPVGDAWSSVVGAALERAKQRAAGLNPPVGRWGRFARRVSNLFAAMHGAGQSPWMRPAFRLICAVVCANLVAFAIENWSDEEALRFPTHEAARGQDASLRHFPFVGKCGSGEFLFLTFDLMLVTGAAAWFAARWLDSRAE